MQEEELIKLVEKIKKIKCETQEIEVKSANKGTPERLYDTLSSFSNQDTGGIIVFGVDEKQNYEVVGVYNSQELIKKVTEQCKQMQPEVRAVFTVAEIEDKSVVSVEIPAIDISERPLFYRGIGRIKGSYIRVGDADEPMSEYEIYSYEAYRKQTRDDIRVVEDKGMDFFDPVMLNKYLYKVKENRTNLSKLEDYEILELTGVTKNGIPTLAGIMGLSKYPQAIFPQLSITAVVVPGIYMGETGEEGERFSDNKRIEGRIEEMLDETIGFINRNMKVKTIINSNGKREDKSEYPIVAVREVILNALMHRDYSIYTEGSPIRLNIFKDRLEITNPGGLYGKLSVDSLGQVHSSSRNQTLTNILEVLGVAENRYSGIPTIKSQMKKFNLPSPEFIERRGVFVVTLRNSEKEIIEKFDTGSKDKNREEILEFCITPRSREELVRFTGRTQYYMIKNIIQPLIEDGNLKLTLPKTPRSKNQKFYKS